MDCDTLIEEMVADTLKRIRDIALALWKQSCAEADQGMPGPGSAADFSDEMTDEVLEFLWHAPLTEVAVHLLWAVMAKAADGGFVGGAQAVAEACATIQDADLKSATGIPDAHLRTVLEKTAESFVEAVRAHGTIDITVDRRPLRLTPE